MVKHIFKVKSVVLHLREKSKLRTHYWYTRVEKIKARRDLNPWPKEFCFTDCCATPVAHLRSYLVCRQHLSKSTTEEIVWNKATEILIIFESARTTVSLPLKQGCSFVSYHALKFVIRSVYSTYTNFLLLRLGTGYFILYAISLAHYYIKRSSHTPCVQLGKFCGKFFFVKTVPCGETTLRVKHLVIHPVSTRGGSSLSWAHSPGQNFRLDFKWRLELLTTLFQ